MAHRHRDHASKEFLKNSRKKLISQPSSTEEAEQDGNEFHRYSNSIPSKMQQSWRTGAASFSILLPINISMFVFCSVAPGNNFGSFSESLSAELVSPLAPMQTTKQKNN